MVATAVDEKGRLTYFKAWQEAQVAHLSVDAFVCAVKCEVKTSGDEVFVTLSSESNVNINIVYARSNYVEFAIHVMAALCCCLQCTETMPALSWA